MIVAEPPEHTIVSRSIIARKCSPSVESVEQAHLVRNGVNQYMMACTEA